MKNLGWQRLGLLHGKKIPYPLVPLKYYIAGGGEKGYFFGKAPFRFFPGNKILGGEGQSYFFR